MAEAYVVLYSSNGESQRCVCGIDCKRAAVNLAKSMSRREHGHTSVWKCTGVWDCGVFHDINSIHVCTYNDGKRM